MSKIIIFLALLLLIPTFSAKLSPLKPGLSLSAKSRKNLFNLLQDLLDDVGNFLPSILPHHNKSSSNTTSQQIALGSYYISIGAGSDEQEISPIMAITNDLIWTRCSTSSTSQFYNPSNSTTFSEVPCDQCSFDSACTDHCSYNDTYIDLWGTYGDIVTDNFTFGSPDSDSLRIYFGCIYEDEGTGGIDGVLGFGNGNYSVVSQLGYERFSYCLSNSTTIPTPINLGTSTLVTGDQSQSIKLINSSYYYHNYVYVVNLTTITVGSNEISIPKSYSAASYSQENTPDGVVLDTVSPISYLDEPIYNATKMAFLQELGLSSTHNDTTLGLDLCFDISLTVPKLQLQFDGSVIINLETWNYIVRDPTNGLQCIIILPQSGGSLMGNSMQLDLHMVYDLANSTLFVEKTVCIKSSAQVTMLNVKHAISLIVLLLCFAVM
ncbi:hypothetical protein LUZ60_001367 [Juncus effusus]|nr:hypothetical protein LUZ60_001367 [Juncus effusus]